MRLVIIGNGITGLSAARAVRKRLAAAQIQLVFSEHKYPYSRTALMYMYMGHLTLEATECYGRDFYEKNRIELISNQAVRADTKARKVHLADGTAIDYDALLIAAGSKPAKYGWPGQDLAGVQGMYSLQDLAGIQRASDAGIKRAVIVGGGLIGIELAEMLRSRRIPVTMLVREAGYASHILPAEESAMVNEEIRRHGIDLRLSSNLKEIKGEGGRASSCMTDNGEEIPCNFVGLTAGVSPNTELAAASGIACARGVLVDDQFCTAESAVFAAGDCAQFLNAEGNPGRVEQLWYTGRIQGNLAGQILADLLEGRASDRKYTPDVFFNSAKFFGIEYQTYGSTPPAAMCVLVQDKARNKSIRISFAADAEDRRVLGFVLMGIRYRQEVCQNWIRGGKSIDFVLAHLSEANFDPEFSRRYESAVQAAYKAACL